DLHGDRLPRAVCPGGSLQKDLVEVGPVEVEIGSSELVPSLCPQRGLRQDLARAPAATDGLFDDQRRRVQSLAHAEPIEDAGGVGPDLQPGTDLAESRGLLEDGDPAAVQPQGSGSGQSSDSATGDDHVDVRLFAHVHPSRAARAPSATTVRPSSATVQSRMAMSRWAWESRPRNGCGPVDQRKVPANALASMAMISCLPYIAVANHSALFSRPHPLWEVYLAHVSSQSAMKVS